VSEPDALLFRSLSPAQLGELWSKHVPLPGDRAQAAFIQSARARPHSRWRTWSHRVLRGWLSDYDVNGLLGMYPMYLLGTSAWRELLQRPSGGTLLDVGAGDGGLTQHIAPLFDAVTTTEASWAMAKRLTRRGYTCVRRDIGETPIEATFDCVTCLNVLDRTAYPLRLLRALGRACRPDGSLVIASPLPLRSFYYRGPRTLTPPERLFAPGPSWERAATQLVNAVAEVLPQFRLVRWTYAPYLSWGDADQTLYTLDDWVGVWQPRDAH
jgi:SAM-dependent methyltransferase